MTSVFCLNYKLFSPGFYNLQWIRHGEHQSDKRHLQGYINCRSLEEGVEKFDKQCQDEQYLSNDWTPETSSQDSSVSHH